MFDAGAIEASLTVRTDQFNKDMDAAEARVKKFESEPHKVKISAVFDQSSLSRARQMFAQLDDAISRDAMTRLRSPTASTASQMRLAITSGCST